MMPVNGVEPLFCPLNTGTLVLPEAPSPMAVLLLLQVNDVPVPDNTTCADGVALQITWSAGSTAVGVGLTAHCLPS